jgi:SAM-dependent methyltransferase
MPCAGLLGDTPERDYGRKLSLFNACAEPELRRAIASLHLAPGMRVLDAGCGTGETLNLLREAMSDEHAAQGGAIVGFDLAAAHVRLARARVAQSVLIAQADALSAPLVPASFDLVWCANTLHHLRDAVAGVERLAGLLRPGGRIALGQSALLPEMYFAWDARLERRVNEAVRLYYQHRYGIQERDLTAVRALVGILRQARLREVQTRTFMIERVSPLRSSDEAYLLEAIFRDTWGERLQPYLGAEDYQELCRLCDPNHAGFALRRPDFHYLQSFTLVVGCV